METLWWTLSLALMALGLFGAVFPVIPDSLFILAGAFLHHFTVRPDHTVGWWTLGILTFLCILAHVVDFTAGAMGARKFGASKWGAAGGMIGGVIGTIFLFPFGMFLGPVVGALCGGNHFRRARGGRGGEIELGYAAGHHGGDDRQGHHRPVDGGGIFCSWSLVQPR